MPDDLGGLNPEWMNSILEYVKKQHKPEDKTGKHRLQGETGQP
jgi:hypothetical protein